jgi:O-antigen ligase
MKKIGLVFFVLLSLIPLIFFRKYDFGYHTPKVLAFWFLIVLYSIILCFRLLKSKAIGFSYNPISLSLFAYLTIISISGAFSISPTLSFYSTFERMDGVLGFLFLLLFYFTFSQEKIENSIWQKIGIVSTIVSCVVSFSALVQYADHADIRAQGTFANPLTLAFYLLFHFILVLSNLISTLVSDKKSKSIYVILSILILLLLSLGIISTSSRGAFLALFLGVLFSGIYYFFKLKSNRKIITFVYGLICVLGVFSFVKLLGTQSVLARIGDLSLKDESASIRVYLWKTVLIFWQEKPFLGWGKEHFVYFFAKHYQVAFHNADDWYDRSHNFLLDKFIESGILGLLAYVTIIGLSIWTLFRKTTQIGTIQKGIILAIIISFIGFHFTNFESLPSNIILFTLLIYISQNAANYKFTIVKHTKVVGIVLLLFLSIFGYLTIIKTIKNYKTWNNIKLQTDNLALVNQYDELLENANVGKYDMLIKYGLVRTNLMTEQSMAGIRTDYFKNAEKHVKNYLSEVPDHPILLSQLGFIQFESGQTAEAIKTYEKLKILAPQRHTNILDLATMYMMDKQYDKAIVLYDYIFSFDKMYEITYLNKAYCLALMGKKDESEKNLAKMSPQVIAKNQEKYNAVKELIK